MSFSGRGKVWMNGALVDWADANIHVASHVIHYGSAVFEGIRCYDTQKGSAVMRLTPHIKRLCDSAKIYRMPIPFAADELEAASLETIRANGFKACYVRPIMYRGYGALGVNPVPCPVDAAILVWEWGAYLGSEALENGVDVCISSWTRMAPNTFPAQAKSSANYANAQLIRMEAEVNGYTEGLALDVFGYVSEGSGENVFVVRNGMLYTPPIGGSILPGITRDSVMNIARDLGYQVEEESIPREMLYTADELFFVGTAVEITPVRSVDRITVGQGRRGPITEAIQRRFHQIISGEAPDTHGWLTFVQPREAATAAATGRAAAKTR
jgi:branched-chain amino acid aminotransferase